MKQNVNQQRLINEAEIVQAVKKWSYPLQSKADLTALFEKIADARIVMLGEASHGTHEYYQWRAFITRKLIEEKGFNFIAVEGDWPDCYRLNRFIKGYDAGTKSTFDVLQEFNRWPTWMWANWETIALADWIKQHNSHLPANKRVGFYGLDIYSLWESMENIMHYLKRTDPATYRLAEEAFLCFEPYRNDEGRSYAKATSLVPETCQNEVVELLQEVQRRRIHYNTDPENVFNSEQNAMIMVNAENYYRSIIKGGPHSWNVRDRHMMDSLERLLQFHGQNFKAIIWAHNTHIGDARATSMAEEGMFNIGELARIRLQDKGVILVGFGSYKGSVIAGRSWGASMQNMVVPEASTGSWEYLLHKASPENKLLIMDDFTNNDALMENHIGHRAIGVVYNSAYEQYGNYVPTIIPLRYDAFIHLDKTRALYPLHLKPDGHQMPETYPFGV